jgi:hypothetical protein
MPAVFPDYLIVIRPFGRRNGGGWMCVASLWGCRRRAERQKDGEKRRALQARQSGSVWMALRGRAAADTVT